MKRLKLDPCCMFYVIGKGKHANELDWRRVFFLVLVS